MANEPDDRDPLSSEELIRRARDGLSTSDPESSDAPASPEPDADSGDSNRSGQGRQPATPHSPSPPDTPEAPPTRHEHPNDADSLPASTPDAVSGGTASPRSRESQPPSPPDWPASTPDDEPDGHIQRAETASPSGWARFWGVGRWVVGGFILVRLFGQCVGSGTTLDDLNVGDCFADPGLGSEVSEIDDVDCNQLHDFELYATVILGPSSRDFPGTVALFDELDSECVSRFPGYVGHDYLTSAYDFVTFTPVEDGWESGDRTGMCALYEFDANFNVVQSIGTARNSGR